MNTNFSPAIMESLMFCHNSTKADGNEHGIGLDVKGHPIIQLHGDHQSIQCLPWDIPLLEKCNTFVHSHPVNGCLSRQDIGCAIRFNCTVVAITPRKDLFWTNGKWDNELLNNIYNKAQDLFYTLRGHMLVECDPDMMKIYDILNHLLLHKVMIDLTPKVDLHCELSVETAMEIEFIQHMMNNYSCLY